MSYRPVDLSASNSIIQAFMAGHQVAQAREKQRLDREELAQRKQLEEERLKQQREEFEQQHKIAQSDLDLRKAANDVALLHAKLGIGEAVEKGGESIIPFLGGKVTGVDYGPTGESPESISFSHPAFNNGQPMTIPSREAQAREQARMMETLAIPGRKTEAEKQGAEAIRESLLENLKSTHQEELKKLELEATKQQKELQFAHDIEVANIRGGYTLKAAQARALAQDQRLTPMQKDKLAAFASLEDKTKEFKSLLEMKDPNGIDNYSKYYVGKGAGFVKEIKAGFKSDATTEEIRRLGSDIEVGVKNLIANMGSALSPNEREMLEKMSPSGDFSLTPVRAKVLVNGFLQGLQNSQGQLVDQYGPRAKSKLVNGHEIGETKKFENGNVGVWDGTGWEAKPSGDKK